MISFIKRRIFKGKNKTHHLLCKGDDPLPLQQLCGHQQETYRSQRVMYTRSAWLIMRQHPVSVSQDAGIEVHQVRSSDLKGQKATDIIYVHRPAIVKKSNIVGT